MTALEQSEIFKIESELLRCALCGVTVTEKYSDEVLAQVYALAKSHDVAHLCAHALEESGALPDGKLGSAFDQKKMQAILRSGLSGYDISQIEALFSDENIPFIPLKGAVIRKFYPEEWMRTSCDVDILVKKSDLKKAVKLLCERLSCTYTSTASHDAQLTFPDGVHLELHFTLLEDYYFPSANKYLESVWKSSGFDKCRGKLSDEMLYFYHTVHMAKHFIAVGIGPKFFIDTYFICKALPGIREKTLPMLKDAGLSDFEQASFELSLCWMQNKEGDCEQKRFEKYVVESGVYGNMSNRVTFNRKSDGKFSYILNRMFIPYEQLKASYPVLEKNKWLLPFCETDRIFKKLFSGEMSRVSAEISANHNVSKESIEDAEKLMKYLGLNSKDR